MIQPVEKRVELERTQKKSFLVATVRVQLLFYFDCNVFDKENQVCTDYENRPELCQAVDVADCGRSSVSKPTAKFAIPILGAASYYSKREVAAQMKERVQLSSSSIQQAMQVFLAQAMREINQGLAR